ncbi:hypothetical protein OAA37_00095 [bacterium]|jgi:hypothetical protein|nr:hypothetical protein [bacterium]MDA8843597.1 hypothetical protein [Euryarchaeota archaeon]MDB4347853.1 hypothetical protein [bacterium]
MKGKETTPDIMSLITVYTLSKALAISPLEIYKMPVYLVKDLLQVHMTFETLKSEEMEKMQKDMERKSRSR